jgi:hypothetical protein
MSAMLGFKSTWVRIVYPLADDKIAAAPNAGDHSEMYIEMNRCGRPVRTTGQRYVGQMTEREAKTLERCTLPPEWAWTLVFKLV